MKKELEPDMKIVAAVVIPRVTKIKRRMERILKREDGGDMRW